MALPLPAGTYLISRRISSGSPYVNPVTGVASSVDPLAYQTKAHIQTYFTGMLQHAMLQVDLMTDEDFELGETLACSLFQGGFNEAPMYYGNCFTPVCEIQPCNADPLSPCSSGMNGYTIRQTLADTLTRYIGYENGYPGGTPHPAGPVLVYAEHRNDAGQHEQ